MEEDDKTTTMKRYIITTAQANVRPHKIFYEGLQAYAQRTNGQLLCIPTFGKDAGERQMNPLLSDMQMVTDTFSLNDSIEVQRRRLRPQMIDPTTGLNHIVRGGKSVIFESPQIRYRTLPSHHLRHPKFLITTGAVTLPNYADTDDAAAERQRLGLIAKDNHTYGAVVVDIESPTRYHFRHIQANSEGTFVDLGQYYHGSQNYGKAKLDALVIGDWHNGRNSPENIRATMDMIHRFKPKKIFLHDFFDGHSVNHHMTHDLIYQMIREGSDKNHLNLELELKQAGRTLEKLAAETPAQIYLVASNHHEFLNRWLDEVRYAKDPVNARLGFKLSQEYAQGKDPVKVGIEMVHGELPDNVNFLNRDSSVKIRGFELGKHGDKGPNDGRGDIKQKEYLYGKSVTGHVHRSERFHNTFTVGTMLPRNIYYMKGSPSGWTHSNGLLWDNGTVQVLNIIDGKYML